MEKIKQYYSLTKPGVLVGNVITGAAGFLLAVGYFRSFDIVLFVVTIAGMTLVIAGACAVNNVLDADIDAKMARTKKRVVAAGQLAKLPAGIFAAILAAVGFIILIIWSNWLVVSIGAVGYVVYVWLYGASTKRKSVHGTLVGSISGAMPSLAGYCAVADRIDAAAVLVFLALFFWQFPEFYSIAIYRRKEYKAAKIPVMPLVVGIKSTVIQILLYTFSFVICTLLLTVFGYTGWVFFLVMALVGIYWLQLAAAGFKNKGSDTWARRMFHVSINVLLIFSLMVAIGPWLP